ncbi:glycosyltransferase family 4 protein [Bradyrhizobium genosp. L]|uniref:glycosyltransferase family 4 protein n=1 Tax=Bradyrhizobium genosp. L TaxID=83637 RepID=UPI0018A2A073|nr:glycosyltransferase family 4 protein [Bradyrhizobium genosp. L]QPF87119.1 glycosyltransferase family 4 protein [Bradyrhizobium genosp. L]
MTGYAYITARMIETLQQSAEVETVNISPGHRRGVLKHVHKTYQTLWACWQLTRHTRGAKLTYIGCEGDWGLVYTSALVMTARMLGYAVLLHHHSFGYVDKSFSMMRFITHIGGDHIRHIFLCTTMRDRFESQYGRAHYTQIISNAAFVAPGQDIQDSSIQSNPIRIGMLSNLTREKGLYTFIDLVRALKDMKLGVEAVLAGPIADPRDQANVAVAERELGGALNYVGPVYGAAKDQFYRELDVFVFPTQYANEAQPTVLFEALAAGNSIIAFDRGCIASQVKQNGIAIAATDDFCARACDFILELSQQRSAAQRRTIIRNFNQSRALALAAATNLTAT